jgi:hypothetical protein
MSARRTRRRTPVRSLVRAPAHPRMTRDAPRSRGTERTRADLPAADYALALFRSRVARMARLSGLFAIAFLFTTPLLAARRDGLQAFANAARGPGNVVSLVIGALLVLSHAVVMRTRLERSPLEALDVALTLLACVGFDATLFSADLAERPELMLALISTNVLLGRAAIVPSTGRRTGVVGGLAIVTLVAATHVAYSARGGAAVAWIAAASAAQWGAIAVAASTLMSRRLYALQRKVDVAERFGQYTLEQKIGEGGMGEVFRARHALLRRPTALKLLPRSRAGAEAIARFEREVQMTSQLSHPCTIQIYDFGRAADGTFYYAMELVDGLTLHQLVTRGGAQPPGRVAKILADVWASLAEAHGAGLVHRDIKPQNVMLCARGGSYDVVKVLDFGLVNAVDDAARERGAGPRAVAGTPAYIAPEAITDPGRLTCASDLYAVGALGYFLLTGAPVFVGAGAFEILGQHLHSAPVPPSERAGRAVPDRLARLVLTCLAKAPEERPTSADALRAALLADRQLATTWTDEDAERWWREHASAAASAPPERGDRLLRVADRGADEA